MIGDALLGEVLAADAAGWDIEEYLSCRAAGAEHADVLRVTQQCGDSVLGIYRGVLAIDGYEQGLWVAIDAGITPGLYLRGRYCGASADELCAMATLGAGVDVYVEGRERGYGHAELREGWDMGLGLGEYCALRADGISHLEACEAAMLHCHPGSYRRFRGLGGDHTKALRQAVRWGGKMERVRA